MEHAPATEESPSVITEGPMHSSVIGESYPKNHEETRGTELCKRQITHDGKESLSVVMGRSTRDGTTREGSEKIIWAHHERSQPEKRIIRRQSAELHRTDAQNCRMKNRLEHTSQLSNDTASNDDDQDENQYKSQTRVRSISSTSKPEIARNHADNRSQTCWLRSSNLLSRQID
jgi:two-component sensor histidine kinase